ncbi:Nuclease A inhibitor-like protein [Pseudarcicella hirudinis]|uniref:Nuclease A inhibitor-like protein n=1 Tax=Pseudarcicella hirudinis TaxID=1079859 RepID=A0A1I5UXN3_9BACT|nr:nuclease A inhibitor family protein [Pseudarcicella hirudinis]SFP99466.1 Nuclease A inhibitor-like protein [Pseudarcicella hirudinis]
MTENPYSKSQTPDLKTKILSLIEGLYYPSESDEPLEYVEFELTIEKERIPLLTFRQFLGIRIETLIQHIEISDFFKPLLKIEDYFDESDLKQVEKAKSLQQLLLENLKETEVLRVGETEVTVYVIGKTPQNTLAGIKTLLIET